MTHKLTVGQELWYVPYSRRTDPREVKIEKIGRKWATLNRHHGRIDMQTLRVDGGEYTSPGKCYLSKEAWETQVAVTRAWCALREVMSRNNPPPDCTVHDIETAAAALGLTLGGAR